jgi:hypothetical protein
MFDSKGENDISLKRTSKNLFLTTKDAKIHEKSSTFGKENFLVVSDYGASKFPSFGGAAAQQTGELCLEIQVNVAVSFGGTTAPPCQASSKGGESQTESIMLVLPPHNLIRSENFICYIITYRFSLIQSVWKGPSPGLSVRRYV